MTMRLASMGIAALIALLASWPAAATPARPDPELGSRTILADGRHHRHHHPHWGYRPYPGYYAPGPYYRPYYPPSRYYYAPPPYYAPYYAPPRYYEPPGPSFYFQFRN